eukprot:3749370-Lingulodinium_polyedra.AAC.1
MPGWLNSGLIPSSLQAFDNDGWLSAYAAVAFWLPKNSRMAATTSFDSYEETGNAALYLVA